MPNWLAQLWIRMQRRIAPPGARPFDARHLADDVFLVIQASSDLDIPEFTLFMHAYEKWFGRPGSEQLIERYYLDYMFNEKVPPWVREYCRQVNCSARDHRLDPVNFGVLPVITRRVKYGATLILLAFGLVALLVSVAEYTVDTKLPHLRDLNRTNISYRPE